MLDSRDHRSSRDRVPEPPSGRAPYALPKGVPALQEDPQRLRRRLLMGIAFAALLAGGSGYLAGRRRRARDGGGAG